MRKNMILSVLAGSIVFMNSSLIPPISLNNAITKVVSPVPNETADKTSLFIFNSDRDIVLRVPFVHQYEDLPEDQKPIIMKSACGPSALTMLFQFYGVKTDLMTVINKLPSSVYIKGVQFYNLPKGADVYGFSTKNVGSDAKSIFDSLKSGKPVILNIQNYNGIIGHAVVIVGMLGYSGNSAEYLVIHDPYVGPYRKFKYQSPKIIIQPEEYVNYIGTLKPFILI